MEGQEQLSLDALAPILKGFGIDESQLAAFKNNFVNFQKDYETVRQLVQGAYDINQKDEMDDSDIENMDKLLIAALELLDKMSGVSNIKL